MLIFLLVTAVILGQHDGVATMSNMEESTDQIMVPNTALCFYEAVGFLQKTPQSPEGYSMLLLEAKEILEGIGVELGEGDFSILQWSTDSLHVLTPSGFPIVCSVVSEEHDSTVEGSTLFVTYSFTVPEEGLADSVTVEISF